MDFNDVYFANKHKEQPYVYKYNLSHLQHYRKVSFCVVSNYFSVNLIQYTRVPSGKRLKHNVSYFVSIAVSCRGTSAQSPITSRARHVESNVAANLHSHGHTVAQFPLPRQSVTMSQFHITTTVLRSLCSALSSLLVGFAVHSCQLSMPELSRSCLKRSTTARDRRRRRQQQ